MSVPSKCKRSSNVALYELDDELELLLLEDEELEDDDWLEKDKELEELEKELLDKLEEDDENEEEEELLELEKDEEDEELDEP